MRNWLGAAVVEHVRLWKDPAAGGGGEGGGWIDCVSAAGTAKAEHRNRLVLLLASRAPARLSVMHQATRHGGGLLWPCLRRSRGWYAAPLLLVAGAVRLGSSWSGWSLDAALPAACCLLPAASWWLAPMRVARSLLSTLSHARPYVEGSTPWPVGSQPPPRVSACPGCCPGRPAARAAPLLLQLQLLLLLLLQLLPFWHSSRLRPPACRLDPARPGPPRR
jgi:hypothetical protein